VDLEMAPQLQHRQSLDYNRRRSSGGLATMDEKL